MEGLCAFALGQIVPSASHGDTLSRSPANLVGRIEGNHSNRNPRFYALETGLLA